MLKELAWFVYHECA